MTEEEINKAIARVILSTKRKKRQYSLYDIALDIQNLKEAKGSLNEVSKIIGITTGMLNQFLSVFKLSDVFLKLVKERKLDQVTTVHYLTKLKENDKKELADLFLSNKLSVDDLRALIPFRKKYPNDSITDLVEKILSSKNIKVSVIKIPKEETTKSIELLEVQFKKLLGDENFITIEKNDNFIDIKVSKEGTKILRNEAKLNKKTFQELLTTLIN